VRAAWWHRLIAFAAIGKAGLGVALVVVAAVRGASWVEPLQAVLVLQACAYGMIGWVLFAGGQRDRRARALGLVFILTAAAFCEGLLRLGIGGLPPTLHPLSFTLHLQPDAFLGYFIWAFIAEFPRGAEFGARFRLTRLGAKVSMGAALVLVAANLLAAARDNGPVPDFVRTLSRSFSQEPPGDGYWAVLLGLLIPAFVLLWTGRKLATPDERRRVSMLAAGLLCCAGPSVAWVFLWAVAPSFETVLPMRVAGWVLYPLLLLLPAWTAYAVLVHRALDVRLMARRAVQYALARQTLLVVAALPVVLLVREIYTVRAQTLSAVLTGPAGASLVLWLLLGVGAASGRQHVADWLDRRFFREQYDARVVLAALVERCQSVRTHGDLEQALRAAINAALHPVSVVLLLLTADRQRFVASAGAVAPLDAGDPLVATAAARSSAFDTDLDDTSGPVASLPDASRAWLADAGARLCLPLRYADGDLKGLLILGEKRSDLPYTAEDRRLLATVTSAAVLSLQSLDADEAHRSGDPVPAPGDQAALECAQCGAVYATPRPECERCAGALTAANVPSMVAGKFWLVERLGDGAMGVVYRALDVELSRAVAIKTLPWLNAPAAARLRREARLLASLSHPNLASIYGVESWRGMPMLVLELLSGGTLAARIQRGPVPSAEALHYGIALCSALDAIHHAGILHRDVKPTNIGFTSDGAPKLLDFGVSRLLRFAQREPPLEGEANETRRVIVESRDALATTTTVDGRLVGTPLYLAPEALEGAPPEPSCDLWALCMVLYESIAGRHPISATSMVEVLARIARCDVPDLRELLPGADPRLAEFFHRTFSRTLAERPASARALEAQLRGLLAA
jgi:hypothetical protein